MREIQQAFGVRYGYPICFTRNAFEPGNRTLRRVLLRAGAQRHRLLPVIDSGVLESDGRLVERLWRHADANGDLMEFVTAPLVVRGGEVCKSDPREVETLHSLVAEWGLCRHSFVLAIGGGAVLDAVGFAAATAHRGLRMIHMPTTVLAQNDAGIGVKNAINRHGRKNFLGTFAPPFAVINDFDFLKTLPERELRAGIAEAVKVALIKDRDFFDHLHRLRRRLAVFEQGPMEEMIVRCAELHLEHTRTSGDPFEIGSARPLDFGHWAAHELEELSRATLRHGEAVAIGIALDSLYSQRVGRIGEPELHAILTTLEEIGFELRHPALARLDVEEGLEHFREHLGGDLCITLLEEIGRGVEVSEVDPVLMRKCIDFLLHREVEEAC
jgi:3-dehydroquinate synthase